MESLTISLEKGRAWDTVSGRLAETLRNPEADAALELAVYFVASNLYSEELGHHPDEVFLHGLERYRVAQNDAEALLAQTKRRPFTAHLLSKLADGQIAGAIKDTGDLKFDETMFVRGLQKAKKLN